MYKWIDLSKIAHFAFCLDEERDRVNYLCYCNSQRNFVRKTEKFKKTWRVTHELLFLDWS